MAFLEPGPEGSGGREGSRIPRVVAVISGKGGVGKTTVVANLAVTFSRQGKRVLVIEADFGLGSINHFFGLAPRYGLRDFFAGGRRLREILVEGPEGIMILPGSNEQAVTALTPAEKILLLEGLDQLHNDFDLVLIDTGAGLSENIAYLTVAAHAILVVSSPDPASMAGAGSLMQLLAGQFREKRFHLVLNSVRSEHQARAAYDKIVASLGGATDLSIFYLGHIPTAADFRRATRRQEGALRYRPGNPAVQAFTLLSENLSAVMGSIQPKGSVQFFWQKMMTGVPARALS